MNPDAVDWTEAVETKPEQEYRALLRSLRRNRSFGLFFVQCSPAGGELLIQRLREDLPQKQIEVLSLREPIDNLYDVVAALPNKEQIDVLFIQGLEHSLYEYEKDRLWNDSREQYNYSESGVPRLLAHLNLSRERFRDHFQICFVFLVPLFALKYLLRRAPDFFDWRSGVFEFVADAQVIEEESQRLLLEGDYEQCLTWTQPERNRRILEIQALLEEPNQTSIRKAELLLKQGNLFLTSDAYDEAIANYNRAVAINSNYPEAWTNRGVSLFNLGRYEEAIASFDRAIALKPDKHQAWYYRGVTLFNLGRYEEAIASYDRVIAINPDDAKAWYNRGIALSDLERYEEALVSYDRVIAINPDDAKAWMNRGNELGYYLGRYEEALASFDRAIAINPNDHLTWYNLGVALGHLGRTEEALTSFDRAIAINPDYSNAWNNRGFALFNLGRYEEAIASYDKALELVPNYAGAFYNKACCYALQGHLKGAIENLQQAISLDSKYQEMAKTDSDFDGIREREPFQKLLHNVVEE